MQDDTHLLARVVRHEVLDVSFGQRVKHTRNLKLLKSIRRQVDIDIDTNQGRGMLFCNSNAQRA
jgi:hypothetical protein